MGTEAPRRPDAPDEARNLVMVVLDSLRYDVAAGAKTPTLDRLGVMERRFSYATWTAPSHHNLLMGLLPHRSPTGVYASEWYKEDFARYTERLGLPDLGFAALLPSLWLPTYLRDQLGYETHALVSMPVLNRHTPINLGFDTYQLMPRHNDMAAMVEQMRWSTSRPSFHLLNVGETHYPYALPDDDPSTWPRISGVHGVFKHLDDHLVGGGPAAEPAAFFDVDQLERLRLRQGRAAEHVDGVLAHLLDVLPERTWLVVTSDHGELFGEGGYFGHGPINHEKVLEVPFLEGLVR